MRINVKYARVDIMNKIINANNAKTIALPVTINIIVMFASQDISELF